MKSKQKLEKINQRFSEDSLLAVSKPQELTTNSTAPLQESLKLEIVGRTPTKDCIDCGTELVLGENWTEARDRQGKYVCKPCWHMRDSQRMWVNGKHISKSHPLYKAGRYKGFEEAAFSSLENYDTSPEGEVYIITNKAWPEWVKVGMAVDSQDRLKNYQTSSPFRDYALLYSYEVKDRRVAESAAHVRLAKECDNINEWFKLPHAVANELILEVIYEH